MTADPSQTAGPPWFYNLRTRQVEGPGASRAEQRLGPFATREEAADALSRVTARNEAWDDEDRRDRDEE